MDSTELSCGGCGEKASRVHQCPDCGCSMHPFCGTPIGPEGFGQHVRCPSCSSTVLNSGSASRVADTPAKTSPKSLLCHVSSSSPIVAAFARAQGLPKTQTTRLMTVLSADAETISASTEMTIVAPLDDEIEHRSSTTRSSARPFAQVVTSIAQRKKVLQWMIKTEQVDGELMLFSKAVDKFPSIFKSRPRKVNIQKAMDWWKKRARFTRPARGSSVVSGRRSHDRVRVNRKCIVGRGRRPSQWVTWLYPVLLEEFDRLRKAGLKFDTPLLRQVALRQFQVDGAAYTPSSVDSGGVPYASKITLRWIQVFMEKYKIVLRAHTGKRQVSPEKQAEIERDVATHLGQLKRDFESDCLDENAVENVDETHFVIDFDNGKTLGFVGEKQVKYADVVSGGEGMTMVVRISGGPSGYIHPPMMVFTNANRSYPIRGVTDNVPDACYRSGLKGWMDQRLFREYLTETRAMSADPRGRKKTIFLDNCSGHLDEDECQDELQRLNARLHYLPPNSTDLCQPADSFVIAKIKDEWARMWNDKKIDLIENEEWQNRARKDGNYSGKLKNPGKRFFLELAAAAVKKVNQKRDKNGINYARNAMMRCGLSLGVDGVWSTSQRFPRLQEIIKNTRRSLKARGELERIAM